MFSGSHGSHILHVQGMSEVDGEKKMNTMTIYNNYLTITMYNKLVSRVLA